MTDGSRGLGSGDGRVCCHTRPPLGGPRPRGGITMTHEQQVMTALGVRPIGTNLLSFELLQLLISLDVIG